MSGQRSTYPPTTKRGVVPTRLERYERTYRALAAELAGLGFISQGSVVVRYTTCGKAGCRCQGDPPRRHGPYYQLPVEPRRRRQDGEPPAQRRRGRALPWLDRQQAPPRGDRRADGADLSGGGRTAPASGDPAEGAPAGEALSCTGGGHMVSEKCGTSALVKHVLP